MTDTELKELKDKLWNAADMLRAGAHLAANKYGQPILGLIFLRYADILYKQHREAIEAEYNQYKGTRAEKPIKDIAIKHCGFYLPPDSVYSVINDKPDGTGENKKCVLVKNAMEAIERENPGMDGVLPKEVYAQLQPAEEPELLSNIMRIFMDIPENISVDLFGEIYEYFLGNFALQEGKDGGTFYTPATVVRYMVEVLQPQNGEKKFLDPACGSGGMFVQAARYMHRHNKEQNEVKKYRCYGVEKEPDTVKLAKMNLLLNNVRGEIAEANSFYSDPHNALGNFDYVMANPPFNVDEVLYERVKDDPRFNTYGVPKNKSKSTKKSSGDKKETVPNANYLWISYFASSLNANGKAALVMANSASDAGGSELEIRQKMISEGIISQMVTLPSNMFSSVTLPATLWFFDKKKAQSPNRDRILFIDARSIFTQVDRAHRKFSDEQIKNLAIITRLYEGDTQAFADLIDEYKAALEAAPETPETKDQLSKSYWQVQIDWLTERFPDGKYTDVIGLCKAASISGEDGIADQDYSLNAGRYVGVVIEDDGMTETEFANKMQCLNTELSQLNAEAQKLQGEIEKNLEELFK
ncbi:MAG: SAM-dependent DNA methyltransferase [Bacteroidales bacterium]|nr:SAM-dependent DNA methyltransferase [Bacteroidales bacterium]